MAYSAIMLNVDCDLCFSLNITRQKTEWDTFKLNLKRDYTLIYVSPRMALISVDFPELAVPMTGTSIVMFFNFFRNATICALLIMGFCSFGSLSTSGNFACSFDSALHTRGSSLLHQYSHHNYQQNN